MSDRKNIYFASDVHLGSAYHREPREVELRLVRWLQFIRPTAKAIYFLGDIFDYWFEYKNVVPRGYVRFLGQLAMMADEGVEIHFFAGNHDVWFSDYFTQEFGAVIHHKAEEITLDGKVFRLSHGDEEYTELNFINKLLYKVFRNKLCWTLYGAIHPRWTVGWAMWASLQSRKRGMKQSKKTLGDIPHAYQNDYFDVEKEPLVLFSKRLAEEKPHIDYFIYGHRHLLLDMAMRGNKRCLILGDWLRYNSYAVWDGQHLFIDQFEIYE